MLKVNHRVAEIVVLDQWKSEVEKRLKTKFAFREVDDAGHGIGKAREFTIDGDVVFVTAWVVKFDDALVEAADPVRGATIYVFRSIFGENQTPNDGFLLDPVDQRPAGYGRGPLTEYEKELWTHFWDYANDAEKAKGAGVRAAHGKAPFAKLKPGNMYKILLRASDGLTISPPEKIPPGMVDSL